MPDCRVAVMPGQLSIYNITTHSVVVPDSAGRHIHMWLHRILKCEACRIGSASLARSIRIRFHFRHRTGRIRSVSDHRAGRVWRSRHRSKTPNCLPGARDQVPALFRNAIERRGASVDSNSGAPITQSTFNMLRRMANLLSLLNWWLHRYDNEDDYALFQV